MNNDMCYLCNTLRMAIIAVVFAAGAMWEWWSPGGGVVLAVILWFFSKANCIDRSDTDDD